VDLSYDKKICEVFWQDVKDLRGKILQQHPRYKLN
jgi:hypothetical protein